MEKSQNSNTDIKYASWNGEKAIFMSAGSYEAVVLPETGANLIKLVNTYYGVELLRTPESLETLKERPQIYGIPVLFPPNRIDNGRFNSVGRNYSFPVNELDKNNHIHGFLHSCKWDSDIDKDYSKDTVNARLSFKATESTNFFKYFPHDFEINLLYSLSPQGLKQEISVINQGTGQMPMGLGFHTAFNTPFHPESREEDYRIRVSAGKRWILNDRLLPTGNFKDLDDIEKKFKTTGISPSEIIMDNHYTAEPFDINGTFFHGALIEDISKKLRLVYETGNKYKHWTIWNNGGHKGFVCPEPQSWAINAPNINLPDEITGFLTLKPGETWKEICKIYVENY
jgi:aldose 1-epimerase